VRQTEFELTTLWFVGRIAPEPGTSRADELPSESKFAIQGHGGRPEALGGPGNGDQRGDRESLESA
jgi:hypothetical protein